MRILFDTPRTRAVSPLCGSACVALNVPLVKSLSGKQYICVVFLLCGLACDELAEISVQKISDIRCICVLSLQYESIKCAVVE